MIYEEDFSTRNHERLSIQCLRQATETGSQKKPTLFHYHPHSELFSVTQGTVIAYVSDREYPLEPGDAILIQPNAPHAFFHSPQSENYVIKFLPDILTSSEQTSREFEYLFNLTEPAPERNPVLKADSFIVSAMIDAFRAYGSGAYAAPLHVRAEVVSIIAGIMERWQKEQKLLPLASTSGGLRLLNEVIRRTRETNGSMKMREAAAFCGFSEAYFSRYFKEHVGTGYLQYAKRVRLAEAERRLKCTDESVTSIAQALNYATASHFIEDFRSYKGITPLRYRNGQ